MLCPLYIFQHNNKWCKKWGILQTLKHKYRKYGDTRTATIRFINIKKKNQNQPQRTGRLDSPEELHTGRTQRDDAAGQPLPLHQRRRRGQFLRFDQAAGDTCGCGAGSRRDDNSQAVVSAASHGAASSIHHETHQEAESQTVTRWFNKKVQTIT